MDEKAASGVSDEGIEKECQAPVLLENGKSRVASLAFKPLPASLLSMVGDYVSKDRDDPVKCVLIGERSITLCLAQDVHLKLASCWSLGFLPPERRWQEQTDVKIDKEFPINCDEAFLDLPIPEDANYCRDVIDVLVVKLSMTRESPSTLDDLRRTIGALQENLSSVKHVVISVAEYASCCFSFQHPLDKVTGLPLPFDDQQPLRQIIDDLQTCWNKNQTLTARDLFDYYFKEDDKPASEKYLAKFVLSLGDNVGQQLFEKEAPIVSSNKLMWVCSLMSYDDFNNFEHVDLGKMRLCHAIQLDASFLTYSDVDQLGTRFNSTFCHRDNPFIERIVINSHHYGRALQLPRPSGPLINSTPLSALIELTLKGDNNTFHLTQLNNGHFLNLAHLSVIGGTITGHLDSQRVPFLKTLIIDLSRSWDRNYFSLSPLVNERCQSLIQAGRPWQLVASREPGGWSLASYDHPFLNPSDEEKEDSSFSNPPLIRELLLVMRTQENADEWQLQLNGNPSLEAAVDDHKDRLLVWAPECVEKITAFCISAILECDFDDVIPGQERILTSLECHNVKGSLDGNALPRLESLKLNDTDMAMSGTFPRLTTLSFDHFNPTTPWQPDAPSLQSLSCHRLKHGANLSLNPQLLPRLSSLQITSNFLNDDVYPNIMNTDNVGFSRVQHVVLGRGMTLSPFFEPHICYVLNLELSLNALKLPKRWFYGLWLCETLKIDVYSLRPEGEDLLDTQPIVVLPGLPRVKKLTVTQKNCQVLVDREMPELVDFSVPSIRSLGVSLRCPDLQTIRFTCEFQANIKEKLVNLAKHGFNGARPKLVYFDFDGEVHSITKVINRN